jgi:xylulokinase
LKKSFESPYVLGIDVGNSVCKASLLDSNGCLVFHGSQEYEDKPPIYDPNIFVTYTLRLLKKMVKNSKVDPEDIKGIGFGTLYGGFVPIDKKGEQLFIWSDDDITDQIKWVEKKLDKIPLEKLPGKLESKILWVKENRPEIYARTHKFLHFKDYIEFKLTGNIATEWSTTGTLLFDRKKIKWSEEIVSMLGIEIDKLPVIKSPTSIIGKVTRKVSEKTGLDRETRIVAGGIDDSVALIGLGALKSNEKVAYELAGTVNDLDVCLDYILPEKADLFRNFGMEIGCLALPETYVLHLGGSLAGAIFQSCRNELYRELNRTQEKSENTYKIMDKEAKGVQPGSNGLIFYLPHFYRKDSGLITGLSLFHTRAHITRAIMEDAAFELLENVKILERLGISVKEIITSGGCSKSQIWRQIKADVLNIPIHYTNVKEPGCLGAGILGGLGTSIFKDAKKILSEHVKIVDTRIPQKTVHDKYMKMYELRTRERTRIH